MAELYAVIYISTANPRFTERQLESLLLDARALNLENNITGVLLYSDGIFMQYFEGAPLAVRETYDRIRASRRHIDIREMLYEPMKAQIFPDWQMGYAQPTRSELLTLSTAQWHQKSAQSPARGAQVLGINLLKSFWARTHQL